MFHVETNNFWLSRATSPMSPHSIEPALPFDASASCKAVVFTHGRLHLSHSDHLHSNTQLSVISTFFLSGRARLTLWSPLGWLSFNIFLFTLRNSSPFRRLCYIRGKANIKETQILDKKSADILRAAGQRQLRFFFFLSFGLLHTTSNWLRQLYGAALSGPPETSSSSSSSFFGESTTGVTFVPLGLTPIETCQLPHQRNNRAVSQQKQQLFRRENKQRLLYLRPQKKKKRKTNSNTSSWSKTSGWQSVERETHSPMLPPFRLVGYCRSSRSLSFHSPYSMPVSFAVRLVSNETTAGDVGRWSQAAECSPNYPTS